MADPKVKVVVEAEGTRKEGVLRPSAGTTIEVRIADSLRGTFGIDYTKPDVLSLRLGGDLEIRLGGKKRVRVEGDLERSLLDGTTAFDGSMTWEFGKDVAVNVDTALDDSKQQVGMKVTLKF